MSWIAATLLALACFAVMALVFRVPRKGWALVLAALVAGLIGFGLQAWTALPGAPASQGAAERNVGGQVVDLRRELVGKANRSRSAYIVTADAMARQGEYETAAGMLRGIVHNNPHDGDAWLALGNALTFHADGRLTPAALFAYNHAARELPQSVGPVFFVGLSLVREGKLVEARKLWAKGIAAQPEGSPGRQLLEQRLGELDELMRRIAQNAGKQGR